MTENSKLIADLLARRRQQIRTGQPMGHLGCNGEPPIRRILDINSSRSLRHFPCTWIMGGGACVHAVARRLRDHTSLSLGFSVSRHRCRAEYNLLI